MKYKKQLILLSYSYIIKKADEERVVVRMFIIRDLVVGEN